MTKRIVGLIGVAMGSGWYVVAAFQQDVMLAVMATFILWLGLREVAL